MSSFYRLFISLRSRSFTRGLKTSVKKRWLETVVPLSIMTGILLGGYKLLFLGATFLLNQGEIGVLLLDRFFYLGWSIIFYLLILSNILTAMSTLYRSPEVTFFITKPVTYRTLFRTKLVENMIYSSWAILMLGIPLSLAYGQVKALSISQISLFLPVGILPFLLIAASIGMSIIMIVVRLSKYFQMRSIFIALGILFSGLFYIYFQFSQQETLLVGVPSNFRAISRYMGNLASNPFPYIPSYWLSEMIIDLGQKDWGSLFYFVGLMLTSSLVAYEAAGWIASRNFYTSFQVMEGTNTRKKRLSFRTVSSSRVFSLIPAQYRALVIKDILQFVRTPQQWIQFLMFGFFITLYLVNLARADIQIARLDPFWQTLIYLFNFGFSGFTLAALTSRFVYPLISLEGHGLWVMLSSPMHLSKLFRVKFWMSFLLFFTLAEIVALVGNYYLGQDPMVTTISTIFLLFMSMGLVSLSLGLGAVFPQFDEQNPMRITSSAGGIITVLASLVYVALMVGAMVYVFQILMAEEWTFTLIWLLMVVLVLNVVTIFLPLRWGRNVLLRTNR